MSTQTNRLAIGARITVVMRNEDGSTAEFHRAVGSVSSFGGSTFRQEIGLGDAEAIERVEVFWPVSQTTQVFEDVPLDSLIRVTEGSDELERLPYKRIEMP